MDRQRLPRAWARAWLAVSMAVALAACQGLPQLSLSDPTPAPPAQGWRVVERLGEARYLAPGMAGWEPIAAGSMIPAGSQVTTGIGGRLIVDRAANQLSAGTGSRFILPGWEPGDNVRQTAGWLRYRIATAPAATFGIETPFLELAVDDAVLDVTVGDSETEVAVVSGRVRVKSLDEQQQIDLHAGYTGYASLDGESLAVRRGPDERLETVRPIVMPALNPHRSAATGAAADATSTAAIAAFADRAAAPADASAPGAVQRGAAVPPADALASPATTAPAPPASLPAAATTSMEAAAEAAGRPAPVPVAQAPAQTPTQRREAHPGSEPADGAPAEEIRRRFDGLTEDLLDGLLPALPQARRHDGS